MLRILIGKILEYAISLFQSMLFSDTEIMLTHIFSNKTQLDIFQMHVKSNKMKLKQENFNNSETNNSPDSMHLLTIDNNRPYVIEWHYLC